MVIEMSKILIVEDELDLQQSLKETLELKQYKVDVASSYIEAIHKINNTIDLVIIDIQLPDGNGIDLCKQIRLTLEIPILFLTANDNEDMLVKGLESGGDDYMTKPFSIKELYARISSLLRRVNTNNSIVRIGDLTIDLNRYEIKKNNELISLSQIDYEIFFMFIKNKNQVLTRNQLLETLEKNGSYDIEDNTLSVHIKRIREKIGLYNNKSYIETLRGIGYRINQEVLNGNK
jgi:DNA-binding response OmpR family regulator